MTRVGPRPDALAMVVRTVPPAVAALGLLAVTPSVVVAATGGHDFTGALSAASLIAGAGAGYAADDPAASTLAASPTTLAVRRLLRASIVLLALGTAWLAALLVARHYGRLVPPGDVVLAELCATASLSAAVATRARTDVAVSAGFGSAVVALLAMFTITSLAYQWSILPGVARTEAHTHWWWISAAGALVAGWSSRDPARRGLRAPSTM